MKKYFDNDFYIGEIDLILEVISSFAGNYDIHDNNYDHFKQCTLSNESIVFC